MPVPSVLVLFCLFRVHSAKHIEKGQSAFFMASAVEEEEFTVDLCKVIQGPKDTPRLLCTFGFVPDSGVSPILINVNGTQLDPGLLLTQE